MEKVKRLFSRFGFAQIAGTAAIMLVSLIQGRFLNTATLTQLTGVIGPSGVLLLTYVPNIFYLLVFWLMVRSVPKAEWQKETLSFRELLKLFVMMYAISTVLNQLGYAISKAAPAGGTAQLDMINSIVNIGLLVGFLIPAVIGPVVEELIFRKLMIDRLHNYGESTVIVFTALCFGLYHGNLTQFLYAASVGVFLGYIYCKTGKVIYTMIIHMLLNTLSSSIMLLLPLVEGGTQDRSAIALLAIGALAVLVAVLMISGIVTFIRQLKKKDFRPDDSMPTAIPKGDVLKTVYLNAGVTLLFIISIAFIVMDLFNITLWQ